ncbi:multidrug effflux MFS transporter [Cognatishimia sp. SS12]|uniref:multidrug effflux MFS transporter n=1 Tax=Cognatishimia sp. SS12 TaxID=2979465 RepID=UPI00232B3A60|nr:multidrug effflux MFS transporter [Cognatishimia sp. SS12]MDC0737131.1 multidrug effflux MFS transporter [Cognatishimia sp. SS12]
MSRLSRSAELEFIALVAMLFATIAFSIDAMLPALTQMGRELTPDAPEKATLVVTIFVLGLGVGTFFAGPLSDAFGRKPIILGGFAIYMLGALWAGLATDLTGILAGRFLQGLAMAGPRIAGLAMVRDLYSGERMASIVSFAMTVFALVPAVAPLVGQSILNLAGWRWIFFAFTLFAALIGLWLALRRTETLARHNRRRISLRDILSAVRECFGNRVFRYAVATQTLGYASLFSMISVVQPIYAQTFGVTDSFPYFFAGAALLSIPASVVNGRLVLKFGMRFLIKAALVAQIGLSLMALLAWSYDVMSVWVFFAWLTCLLFSIGFIFGNLNALALEPLGHIAGLAASINGAAATVVSALMAIPVSLSFDGTPLALLIGVLICAGLAQILMLMLGPRQLTQPA